MRKYWKTKDGRRLKISEMETSHIVNCVILLKRCKLRTVKDVLLMNRRKMLEFYLTCQQPNGEVAQEAFDREFNYWLENWEDLGDYNEKYLRSKNPYLTALEKELGKRREKDGQCTV